jgi:hypothetical protein
MRMDKTESSAVSAEILGMCIKIATNVGHSSKKGKPLAYVTNQILL